MTRCRWGRARWAVLGGLALTLAACSSKAPSALDPAGPEARRLAGIWWLMFGLAAAVYVVVAGLILYGSLRGRGTEAGKPSRARDATFLWWGGLGVPVVILGLLAVVTVDATGDLRRPADDPLRIEVEAQDWWWAVRYPDLGITTANEIQVPVDRPLEITLTSVDVVHSFWVPRVAGKVDAVPGQTNVLRTTVDTPGVHLGECAEYCGLQHARMRFALVATDEASFDRWVTRRQAPGGTPSSELEARGRQAFERESCAGCHTIRATSADGTVGPDLTDLGSRLTLGAGTIDNTPENLAAWIRDSQEIKAGNLMPPFPSSNLSDADVEAIVAYLESLP